MVHLRPRHTFHEDQRSAYAHKAIFGDVHRGSFRIDFLGFQGGFLVIFLKKKILGIFSEVLGIFLG